MAAKTNKGHNTAAQDDNLDDEAVQAQALEAAAAAFAAAEGEEVLGTGFAPYLKPVVGLIFKFVPLMIDARTPNFVRYTCQNIGDTPLKCATGPVKDAEEVIVKPGEIFSISKYATLPLDEMMGLGILAFCDGRREMPPIATPGPDFGKPRSPMYTFKFKMTKEDSKNFKERRASFALEMANKAKELAAAKVNGLPVSPSTHQNAPAQQGQLGARS